MKKEDVGSSDPASMSSSQLSNIARNQNHPLHTHAASELKRRSIKRQNESMDNFEPHMMYDPKTGKGKLARVMADHLRMKKMGWSHDKPQANEGNGDDMAKNSFRDMYKRRMDKKFGPGGSYHKGADAIRTMMAKDQAKRSAAAAKKPVTEISVGKAIDYAKKAVDNRDQAGRDVKHGIDTKDFPKAHKALNTLRKRSRGSNMYTDKMLGRKGSVKPTAESVEEVASLRQRKLAARIAGPQAKYKKPIQIGMNFTSKDDYKKPKPGDEKKAAERIKSNRLEAIDFKKPGGVGAFPSPTTKQVKQGIGVAKDKRYAGGNMTGASKVMNKIHPGLDKHPAVSKELRKQNEANEVNELSKSTLGNYIKTASNDASDHAQDQGKHYANKAYTKGTNSAMKVDKRRDGIRVATNKLVGTKNEANEVSEVSQATLSNYMRKSTADAGYRGSTNKDVRTMDKRIGGQKMADNKLRKMDGKGSIAKVAATEVTIPDGQTAMTKPGPVKSKDMEKLAKVMAMLGREKKK